MERMMKSRHFKELALILSQLRPSTDTPAPTREWVLWETLADEIAGVLERSAGKDCRFDRGKWEEAVYGHAANGEGVSK
jgi:hypothetical protein